MQTRPRDQGITASGANLVPSRAKHVASVLIVSRGEQLFNSLGKLCSDIAPDVQVQRIEDYLSLLGHLATLNSGGKPDLIMGRVSEIEDAYGATAWALRQVCPDAKLILLAGEQDQAQALRAVKMGFDDFLLEPVDSAALARLMQIVYTQQEKAVQSATTGNIDTMMSALRSAILNPHFSHSKPYGQGQPDGLSSLEGTPSATGELGDIDLVDQILASHDQLAPLATKLIADHCGIEGIAWSTRHEAVSPSRAAVDVELDGTFFGRLHAPGATTQREMLQPWAGWLARWLTLEKRVSRLWDMALHDDLTGVWNRRYLNHFLQLILQRAGHEHFRVTVMVFDIDDFKLYNDRYGHSAGDEILQESARLMVSVVRDHDVVARIGGDEFAVIFWDADEPRRPHCEHPATIRKVATRFQQAICQHRFPKLAEGAPGTLTISGGLAGFPWDGQTPQELLKKADEMALESKRQGKNVLTFGPGAQR